MEIFNTSLKNLSKNKIYLILIGLAAIVFATVLIYAYVEFSGTQISVTPTEEGKPYCGAIGSRSEGWYIDSGFNRPELIRWDNCNGCSAICKAIGSRSEGWYSSCDNRLIKWDNCGKGQEENLSPVIDGLTAPTQLQVNEKGVWTIKARDPENGVLKYSVNWGDEYGKIALSESAPAKLDARSQTTTFTHSYNKIGTYTIKFIVTDDHRQTAEISTTVKIVSKISEATCTDSDGGINKYVKGKTCREIHYSSSVAVSCKTDMCDGLCYSQSTSTNLDGKESNITSSSHGDPTSTDLKKDHKTPSLPPYFKDFPPIEPPTPVNPINAEAPLVKEYYCKDSRIFSKLIHCENGCANGACIEENEKLTCDAKCKSLNYKSGICRTWPVVPDVEWGCKENEKDIGKTSDCTLVRTIGGIDEVIVGVGKTCCCKIECNEKLNKEDCELVGGTYESYPCPIGYPCDPKYYCKCPCKTDSDCGADRCGQGRDICHELRYKCENGKCEHTKKEYKGYSCARYYDPNSLTPGKCLDTCGDGVCKSPENKLWCPEDCKEEVVYDLDEYYSNIDYSCNIDSDCVIKDVHNCCGYYPKCVNKDAKVDPDYVRKACAVEEISSACGYPSIDSCKCVQNKCEGFLKEEETLSADLNCDEKVNLVDMAILLSWWRKDPFEATDINQDGIIEESILSPCKNPDINQDGKINLVDFGIMLSQWTTL